ncbi:hypothetical protein [Romboutsia sp.]|nr:hypothetical protein [Romboutsia sp.]HSQ90310.1 hypothetical protein [Romboutsia sp.]
MAKQKSTWGTDIGLKYKWENENKDIISEVKTYKLSKEELEEYLKKFKRK